MEILPGDYDDGYTQRGGKETMRRKMEAKKGKGIWEWYLLGVLQTNAYSEEEEEVGKTHDNAPPFPERVMRRGRAPGTPPTAAGLRAMPAPVQM